MARRVALRYTNRRQLAHRFTSLAKAMEAERLVRRDHKLTESAAHWTSHAERVGEAWGVRIVRDGRPWGWLSSDKRQEEVRQETVRTVSFRDALALRERFPEGFENDLDSWGGLEWSYEGPRLGGDIQFGTRSLSGLR